MNIIGFNFMNGLFALTDLEIASSAIAKIVRVGNTGHSLDCARARQHQAVRNDNHSHLLNPVKIANLPTAGAAAARMRHACPPYHIISHTEH